MNAAGNRHVANNMRLMIINNGRGTEFRNYNHPAERFGEAADFYMAAAGHFRNMSHQLIKHYAEDLGYEYMSASNKGEYLASMKHFFSSEKADKPMIFEVFTDSKDESEAIKILQHLESSPTEVTKKFVRNALGDTGVAIVKKILNK